VKWVTTIILTIATTLSAVARIGDPVSNVESRYGKSYENGFDEFEPNLQVMGFDKEAVTALRQRGFELFVVVDADARVRQMTYVKSWGGMLSYDEVRGMLTANGCGLAWTSGLLQDGSSVYVRSDGAIARSVNNNQFHVMTHERAEALGLVLADS
jgi:hypothetical protein